MAVVGGFRGIRPATLHCREANSGEVRAEIPLRPRRRDCHVCFTPVWFFWVSGWFGFGWG